MSDARLSNLGQISNPIDRSLQNVLLDDGINTRRALLTQLVGSGSGAANTLAFLEEITEITDEMWASIADGSFDKVHVGMHYTAPSGRTYFFADADYYFGAGYPTEQTDHHMLVIEDEITITAQHQTTDVTTGGATSSLIYTTTLPAHQTELEADFGADHILTQAILFSNAVANGMPSNWAWADKKCTILDMCQVFGHYLQFPGNTNEMYNGGNRVRQLALFQHMPETIIARLQSTQARQWWWLDDVASAAYFAVVHHRGNADGGGACYLGGVRRAFLIG